MDNKDRVEEWKLVEVYKYTKVTSASDIYEEYIQMSVFWCIHRNSTPQPNLTDCD